MSNVHLNEDEVEIPGFRITGILARGKVSTVFSAIQDVPVRPVALKLFKPTTVDDVRIKRFFQEADILLRLQHPGLARLIQTGMCHTEIGKHHFHVFEPIEGIPITQYADERNLNSRQRLELFLLVCDILSYVHQEGVLHRNLKPDNILVDRHGQPKLIDFGMARLVTGAPKLTTRGQIVGNL
ncbi:protein kinase, partial [Candidatus Sumerlaeota bacterium]|nr:protein kinase [Candidatus Sumerlaeota bacterium]